MHLTCDFFVNMYFCLFCKKKFVSVANSFRKCGVNKRKITQKVCRREFTVLDVLKRLHNFQVVILMNTANGKMRACSLTLVALGIRRKCRSAADIGMHWKVYAT